MRKKKPEGPLEPICIQTLGSRVEAELARGLLESNGVSAAVSTDSAGGLDLEREFVPGVRLLVKRKDARKALVLLKLE